MNKIKYLFILFLTTFILVELFAFATSKLNLLYYASTPEIYRSVKEDFEIRTEKELWGAWKTKNTTSYLKRSCFNVKYETNNFGARDKNFTIKKTNKRAIILGDSFLEGWGVDYKNMLQTKLEDNLNFEFYNFGSAGDFGPLQYYLIYKNLAKKFEYDELFIFLSPTNDFTDNNYQKWKNIKSDFAPGSERYRPYYLKIDDEKYTYFYPENAVKRKYFLSASGGLLNEIKNFLRKYFWSYNAYVSVKHYLLAKDINKNLDKKFKLSEYSGYHDPDIEEQKALVYFIRKIINESNAKKKYLILIPKLSEIERIKNENNKLDIFWYNSLKNLTKNDQIFFIDLMKYSKNLKNPEKLYIWCDGHLSNFGNEFFANKISDFYKSKKQVVSINE